MIDLTQLAQQASDALAPALHAAEPLAEKALGGVATTAGGKLFTWLSEQFKGKPAAATLQDAREKAKTEPDNSLPRDIVKLQIQDMAQRDPNFRDGLAALLQSIGATTTTSAQSATASGGSKIGQLQGNNSTVNIH